MPGMAPISLQQFINPTTGRPYAGARALFTEASSNTQISVYQDYALSNAHPNPVVADSQGRFPPIFIDEDVEFYGLRVTTSSGSVLPLGADGNYDIPTLPVIGPATGSGGSVTATDPASIFQTGDTLWVPKAGTRTGWVRMNGRTIGSASSGASERASDDTDDLYAYLWDNFADSICAVTGGRGVSAAVDFAANKPIAMLDMRARGVFGLVGMGNSNSTALDAITFALGSKTTAGGSGGTATHMLTEAQLPAHTHAQTAQNPTFTYGTSTPNTGTGSSTTVVNAIHASSQSNTLTTASDASPGDTASTGSGDAHPTIPPFMLGTWYMKL